MDFFIVFFKKITYITMMDFSKTIINFKFLEEEICSSKGYGLDFFSSRPTHRYVMTYQSENLIEQWYNTSLSSPSVNVERINGLVMRHVWQPMEITLRDQIGEGKGVNSLMNWFYNDGEKKEVKIEKLDPTGVIIETWLLLGTIITEMPITPMINEDFNNITIGIRFDSCQLIN